MSDMKCSICKEYGIYWKNLHLVTLNQHFTYCPHCENTNCQEPETNQLNREGE